jgi:hypothetical protein
MAATRVILGSANALASALLVFHLATSGRLLFEEAPLSLIMFGGMLVLLCSSGLFLARSFHAKSDKGRLIRRSLRVADALGACLSAITAYMAFSISAVWAGAIMGILAILFFANALLLQKAVCHV